MRLFTPIDSEIYWHRSLLWQTGRCVRMLVTVSLLRHSQCDTLSTVSASRPGDDPSRALAALGWSGPCFQARIRIGVGLRWIRFLFWFYPFSFPMSSIDNRIRYVKGQNGQKVCGYNGAQPKIRTVRTARSGNPIPQPLPACRCKRSEKVSLYAKVEHAKHVAVNR